MIVQNNTRKASLGQKKADPRQKTVPHTVYHTRTKHYAQRKPSRDQPNANDKNNTRHTTHEGPSLTKKKTSRFATFEHDKISRFMTFHSQRKYLICHVLCHAIFKLYKNPIFQIQRFLWVGPPLGGGVELGRADRAWPSPRPAQRVIFSNHGPKPDLICEIPIPCDVGPARPTSFQYHRSSARPGP